MSSSYYERADLGHSGEVGCFATGLMQKFFSYFNAVLAQDGALTRREKALIGLGAAHSKQCPYCIDSFTNTCVDLGMAAALEAGADVSVPAVVVAETVRGRPADAPVNRVLKAVAGIDVVDEAIGRTAARLLGTTGSAATVDAIVAATAIEAAGPSS